MLRLPSLVLVLMASACVADVDMPLDGDLDGLLSNLEEELGTDPNNPDSDEDGFTDGHEYNSGTNPLSADDHPYLGGWPMDRDCEVGFSPTGNDVGDITDALAGIDQFAEQFTSLDFCKKVILIEFGAFW